MSIDADEVKQQINDNVYIPARVLVGGKFRNRIGYDAMVVRHSAAAAP